MSDRVFLDTVFIQALLNPRDDFHNQARQLFPRIRTASEVWITDAIFIEVGNALSAFNRESAVQFIQQCYRTNNIRIISVDTELLMQALALYQSRSDKTWGLTDCISFIVMQQQNLTDAVTSDRHFVQAGFRALMLQNGR
ncbi:MAG: PIN domain-containing protein [Leptolyngbyaceae bacterium]|nr:PIN domain-containing protein [Leptolyngbyaceae bacterium]